MVIDPSIPARYLDAGLSVLPAIRERKHPAVGSWKAYQDRLPSDNEVEAWFANRQDALCLVCGTISGNLEVIDFDNGGELFEKWKSQIPAELFARMVVERTPSGGYHVVYRCEEPIQGNMKLAMGKRDEKVVTLIETRGEGGLFLCAPSGGYELLQGDFEALPVLTVEDRKALLRVGFALNEFVEDAPESKSDVSSGTTFAVRPGDDYNQRGNIRELLLRYGWTYMEKKDGSELFRRPGKNSGGCSASLKDGVFYVFSSNAYPFQSDKGYSAFQVYSLLVHNGDFTKAADDLLQQGYGNDTAPDVDLSDFWNKLDAPLTVLAPEPVAEEQELFVSVADFMSRHSELRPPIIHGFLREGETMNIIASPKTGKSWLVLDLAVSVAMGYEWQGYPCNQGRVLIIDNELHPDVLTWRLNQVLVERGVTQERLRDRLFIFSQRGRLQDINFMGTYIDQLAKGNFKMIIVDAFYRVMPKNMDENDNGTMASVYNLIDRYAGTTGAAFVLIHHTTKGVQANKAITDVGAGAGSQSRACDTHVVLRRHEEEGVVVMDGVCRSFAPPTPCCLRFSFPVWNRDDTLNPAELEGREIQPKRTKSDPVSDIDNVVAILDTPMSKGKLEAKVQIDLGYSYHKAREIVNTALELGAIEERTIPNPSGRGRSITEIFTPQ